MTGGAPNLVATLLRGYDRWPSRTALQVGSQTRTYAQLNTAALSTAAALGAARRVGVLAGATPAAHIGVLAALYAGAAAVPLNLNFPPMRLAAMIRAAAIDVVVVDERGAALMTKLATLGAGVRCVVAEQEHSVRRPLADPRQPTDQDLAYVMFTSGSSGQPKGVPISHGNLRHFLSAAQDRHQVTSEDILAQTFEPTFDLFMFGPLMAWGEGATVVVVPPQVAPRLSEFVTERRITLWFSVPSMIRLAVRTGFLRPGGLPTLTRSLFCGEPLTVADARTWREAAPNSSIDNLYGPTEATIACTAYTWPEAGLEEDDSRLLPIGGLHAGLRGVLVDDKLRPAREVGELCVAGPQVFRGYLDPADDEGRFLFLEGIRWFRTGDRVRRVAEGGLTFLGRLDDQVKVHGYRVELLEVEHQVRRLPGVTDCAVVAIELDGATTLAACYTGQLSPSGALARGLAERLPHYMIPTYFRHTANLPRNTNGKVDRRSLKAEFADLMLSGLDRFVPGSA